MALPAPDMTQCTKKCKCTTGINRGLLYDCQDPCDGGVFVAEQCDCLQVCSGTIASASGGAGITINSYALSGVTGITFTFQAYTVPDKFTLSGAVSYTYGPAGGSGTVFLPADPSINYVTVTVEGPPGTGWNYTLTCS